MSQKGLIICGRSNGLYSFYSAKAFLNMLRKIGLSVWMFAREGELVIKSKQGCIKLPLP